MQSGVSMAKMLYRHQRNLTVGDHEAAGEQDEDPGHFKSSSALSL